MSAAPQTEHSKITRPFGIQVAVFVNSMFKTVLCVLLGNLVTTAHGHADRLVVPGVRLWQVRLSATRAQVHKVLKNPDLQRTLTGGIREESWRTGVPYGYEHKQRNGAHWKYHFVNVYFQNGRAVQIETNSPRFHTRDGLSVQSLTSRWARTFRPSHVTDNLRHPFINPDPGGIPATKHFLRIADAPRYGIGWRDGFWANLSPDFEPTAPLETLAVHRIDHPLTTEPDGYERFVFTSRDVPKSR